jgi:hypothetical protein
VASAATARWAAWVVQDVPLAGREPVGFLQQPQRFGAAAGLERDDAEQVRRADVVRVAREQLTIDRLRLAQPPGEVVIERDLQWRARRHEERPTSPLQGRNARAADHLVRVTRGRRHRC